MRRWLLCTMILGGAGSYAFGGQTPTGLPQPDAPPGPEGAKCLAVAAADDGEAWKTYCAGLSPATRSDRCAAHQGEDRDRRAAWCSQEWRDKPAVNMGPWAGSSSAVEPQSPRRCDDEGAGECCYSPIVIDILGDGFDLTAAATGVDFDIRGDGTPVRVAWTSPDPPDSPSHAPDDVWLALDRDGNGTIDGGHELFGNFTLQPRSDQPNGFIALAQFDRPEVGGNGDSKIDAADGIFASLRLWDDRNHNGKSERDELFTLPALGVAALRLDYEVSRITDEHGNAFRYRAKVQGAPGSRLGPYAYDVFLMTALSGPGASATCGGGGGTPPHCYCVDASVVRSTVSPWCDLDHTLRRYRCNMEFTIGSEARGLCVEDGWLAGLNAYLQCSAICRSIASQRSCI